MRWYRDAASKLLVSLKRLAAEEILKVVPPRDARQGEITYVHTMSATLDGYATEPATDGSNRDTKPPCCSNCNGTEGKELLIPGMLYFATFQTPIHVLISSACRQTSLAYTIRKEDGVIHKSDVILQAEMGEMSA